jgi:hypothetical protein
VQRDDRRMRAVAGRLIQRVREIQEFPPGVGDAARLW